MRIGIVFVFAVALSATACNRSTPQNAPTSSASALPEYTEQEKAELLASFPEPYNQADLGAGAIQFGKCRSCHTVSADKINLTGPHLYGLFGRKAGTESGYTFTDQMKAHEVVWDFQTLDEFIQSPQTVVKGTKMGYMGIKDDEDRRNLVAWLAVQTAPRPQVASKVAP